MITVASTFSKKSTHTTNKQTKNKTRGTTMEKTFGMQKICILENDRKPTTKRRYVKMALLDTLIHILQIANNTHAGRIRSKRETWRKNDIRKKCGWKEDYWNWGCKQEKVNSHRWRNQQGIQQTNTRSQNRNTAKIMERGVRKRGTKIPPMMRKKLRNGFWLLKPISKTNITGVDVIDLIYLSVLVCFLLLWAIMK